MTTHADPGASSFRARRDAKRDRQRSASFEPECELVLDKLPAGIQAEVRGILRRYKILPPLSSRLLHLRGLVRMCSLTSDVTQDLHALEGLACLTSLTTFKEKVEAGSIGFATAAMSLAALRTLINAGGGRCPPEVGRLHRVFKAKPGKEKSHRVGAMETYLDAAAALGAIANVFAVAGRHRAALLRRDAALLALSATIAPRRGELLSLDAGDVTVRSSATSCPYLSVKIWMAKVGRPRVAIIRDQRSVLLITALLEDVSGEALFSSRAGERFTADGIHTILCRLGTQAHGASGGANIFRRVTARSAKDFKSAAIGLGQSPTARSPQTRIYRGDRAEQGLELVADLPNRFKRHSAC